MHTYIFICIILFIIHILYVCMYNISLSPEIEELGNNITHEDIVHTEIKINNIHLIKC
jgi:cell division protein FtsL